MNIACALLTLAAVTPVAEDAAAQSRQVEAFERVARQYRESREALGGYTWQQRVRVSIDGEEASTYVYEVRFAESGALERTLIDQTSGRGKKERTAAEDARKAIDQFMDAYTHMSPADFARVFANAAVFEGEGDDAGLRRLRATDVLRSADVMHVVVDQDDRLRQFAIETSLQREPVQVDAEFEDLADGPTYLARSTVVTRYKKKQVTLETENTGHRRIEP